MRILKFYTSVILAFTLCINCVAASEVTLSFKKLTLNANLVLAQNKNISDGMIIITHAGLAHRGMELYVHLQELFRERGYSTLAINLSLGLSHRHGMYDCKQPHRHRYTDAADEIAAWTYWLKSQGVKQIVILGHSRGGAESALFASEQDDPAVKAVVLLAPDTQETNNATAYQRRHKKSLDPILQMANILLKSGEGSSLLVHTDFLYCQDTSVSAETFVSYYGSDPRLDTAYLVPKIKKPTYIVIAGNDEVLVNNAEFLPLARLQHVQVKMIEGADHFLRDLFADDAIDAVTAFLQNLRI